MKKCISCNQDIEDGAAFCPFCGKPQEGEAKKQFSITQRAFLRLFRPSFFNIINLRIKNCFFDLQSTYLLS